MISLSLQAWASLFGIFPSVLFLESVKLLSIDDDSMFCGKKSAYGVLNKCLHSSWICWCDRDASSSIKSDLIKEGTMHLAFLCLPWFRPFVLFGDGQQSVLPQLFFFNDMSLLTLFACFNLFSHFNISSLINCGQSTPIRHRFGTTRGIISVL